LPPVGALLQAGRSGAAFLDRACACDPGLRRSVESLLAAYEAGAFLEVPALVATAEWQPAREGPGAAVGPYRLLEQIGEGGMGLVFAAEQQHPVYRRVALKVIKPGMDSALVVARFEQERQALALMYHPNIAKVLDAGTTAAGLPYFVMELVKGESITRFCDRGRLTPRERLGLFVSACQAVQHAHTKGVIHRDIKPSNVLVTAQGGAPAVKVIDFGVAKAVGQHLTDKTVYTHVAQLVGTPRYMNPEQAEPGGRDVDTRSDVYALGVLLYELLTGTTPFDGERLRRADDEEVRRILREEEPPKPSARARAGPRRLSQLLRGDLDWVVMKALEKDRTRRYDTASAFAADVERYLREEPVLAGPPSPWYRFRKFARRNRAALATASAAVAALALVLGVSVAVVWSEKNQAVAARKLADEKAAEATLARQSAAEQRNLALETLNDLVFSVQEQIRELEDGRAVEDGQSELLRATRRLRQQLLDQAVTGLRRVQRSADNARALDESMAAARVRMGEVFLRAGQSGPARQEFELARGLADGQAPREEALAHCGLGDVSVQARDAAAAQRHYERAVELLRPLAADGTAAAPARHDLSGAYRRLAQLSLMRQNPAQARDYFLKSLEHLGPWAAAHPDNAHAQIELYDHFVRLARLSEQAAARDYFRQALDVAKAAAAADPQRPAAQLRLWTAYHQFGKASLELGDLVTGRDHFREAARLREARRLRLPKKHLEVLELYDCLLLAQVNLQLGDAAEARTYFEKLVRAREAQAAADPQSASLKAALARECADLAWLLATHPAAAFRDPARAVALARRAVELAPADGRYRNALGVAHYRAGDWRNAADALTRSAAMPTGAHGADYFFLAMARWRLGEKDQGREWYRKGVDWMRRNKLDDAELGRFRAEAGELLGVKEQ
jgi:serine/threonine protein kinase